MSVQNSQLIRLLKARERNDRATREKNDAMKALAAAEREVQQAMEDAKDKTITRDLGPPWGVQQFQPRTTAYGEVYDLDALREWAKAEGREIEFINDTPAVRKAPVNQLVRRALKTKGMRIPPGVEVRRTPYVTVTDKNK